MTHSESKQFLNYRKMKRILYIAAMTALLMTSCQKTDILNVAEDTIDFSTEVGKLTKADYSSVKYNTLKDQGFRVWTFADFTLGSDLDGTIYREMANLPVHFTGTGFEINSSKKYFWPAAGNYLYFHVLSAKNETWLASIDYKTVFLLVTSTEEDPKTVTGLDLPTYTVNENADDDIMVADSIRQDKSKSKTVSPLFKHTMTQVRFNFQQGAAGTGEDDAAEASVVILKGIQTEYLSKVGNLDVTYSATEDKTTTVDIDETKMSFKWTPTYDVIQDGATYTNMHQFKAVPSDNLVIVKNSSTIISQTAPAAESTPTEGDKYAVYDGTDKTYTVKTYTSNTWNVEEVLTYDNEKARWSSAKYEAFPGKVLTGTMENFVTWYMIPQELTMDHSSSGETAKTVRISYVADGKHIDQSFSLKGSTVTKWSEEVCVNYNVTIAPHKIQFNPSVGDWDKTDVGMDN